MDTRTKIVGPASLPRPAGNVRIAKGWFDVLTAEHCELLKSARPEGGALVVLVYQETELRPAPLCANDRAQMVAALEPVDWVCVCAVSDAESIAEACAPDLIIDIDLAQKRDVVRDVLELHTKV